MHQGTEAKNAVLANNFDLLPDQPVRSPDLNPIENLFACLRRRLAEMYVDPAKANVTKGVFVSDIIDVLVGLQADGTIDRLCRSMPRRLAKVIEKEGGPTGY